MIFFILLIVSLIVAFYVLKNEKNENMENLNNQPMVFKKQFYPKNPYSIGKKCKENNECSAAAFCDNGTCKLNIS